MIRTSSWIRATDILNLSSNFTRSLAEQVISFELPAINRMRRLIFIVYPYAVARDTAPTVGKVTSKVARSPTAPAIGVYCDTSTTAE